MTRPVEHYSNEDISFASLREDIQGYSWETFRADLYAGLNSSLVTIPQAMAFALVAGLPLSCGLFSAIFSSILASLCGSCRHLISGPSNAISMLIQFGTAEILYTYYRHLEGAAREAIALQVLTQLCLLIGVFQIGAALFRLGRLTQFVSLSVLVGYQAGTAAALVISQLFTFSGMTDRVEFNSLFSQLYYFFGHLAHVHGPTVILGSASLFLLVSLYRYNHKIPAALIVLGVAGMAAHALGLTSYSDSALIEGLANGKVALVGDAGEFNALFPQIAWPSFNFGIMNHLLPMAFAIALLSTIETTLIAKSVTASSGQPLSVNQEIFGLGMGNLCSAFIGAMPCSGSISRSAILYRSGGKTHFSGVMCAIWVWVLIAVLGYFVERTPLAALSAILIFTAGHIVRWEQLFMCLKTTPSDAIVFAATFISCLVFGLDIAFYVGVVFSVSFYLKKAAVPYLVECTFDDSGQIGSFDDSKEREKSQIRVINVQGEMFFGAADLFQNMLKSILRDDKDLKVIILRLKNARDMDATACLALQQLDHYLKLSGRHLLACGLTHPTWEVLSNSGTIEAIGKENLFIVDDRSPKLSLQKAIKRAKILIAQDFKRVEPISQEPLTSVPQEIAVK